MNILQQQNGNKGSFYIEENNQRLAQMTYSMAGEKLMIIDHTEVSDVLRGKGAGKQLVEATVQHARNNTLKILPLCPFAKSVFDKTIAYHDVLDK
ncbi:MAG: N-acetyltransferase [Cyclobacteriaceae bacterium]|nr:N-acetyltransferase [Cyclobacteriaceae bacterium]UYN85977.1 MAG: N-acetyltransferase [Cyclobacteriaceae bacterium]